MVFLRKIYLFAFFVEYDWSKTVRTEFDRLEVEFTPSPTRSDFVRHDQNYCAIHRSKNNRPLLAYALLEVGFKNDFISFILMKFS